MHSVVGSNRFGSAMSYKDMALAPNELANTTCNIPADNSVYWAPSLYYKSDGKFALVPFYLKAYYFNRGNTHPLAKMPIGLRMIRGDPHRKTRLPKPDEIHNDTMNLFWYGTDNGGFPSFLTGEWQVRIMFPNCWDGKNLQTANYSTNTHVLFRDEATGMCPPSHPVRIPQLFVEVVYSVGSVTKKNPHVQRSDFIFGTGDTEGWGAHADYISGWHQEVLDAALETCDNNAWSNPKCAFHQFDGVVSKNPKGYYKGAPVEEVDGIKELHVSGQECHQSGFPPAPCHFGNKFEKPAPLRNDFGVFGKRNNIGVFV
jgi:hypothetical protein